MALRVPIGLLLLFAAGVAGCGKPAPAKSASTPPPAKVDRLPDETDINRITLTVKAIERLGIATVRVELRSLPRRIMAAGDVMTMPGNTIVVAAPTAGTLAEPQNGAIPRPGARVEAGQALFSFLPFLSPERDLPTPVERVQMANARVGLVSSQIVAAGDVKRAQAEVDGAEVALRRAMQLLADKAGSARAVDDAKASRTLAEKQLEAAEARKRVLDSLSLAVEAGELKPIPITAPSSGILMNLSAAKGQTVTAGSVLFEIVDLDRVWVRVGVYVGQLPELDERAPAIITDLRGNPTHARQAAPEVRLANPVPALPSADPKSATVDLYYALDNTDRSLRPGERVGVSIAQKHKSESPVVPWAAVLHDIHGDTWVYERTAPSEFRRRRIMVRFIDRGFAALAHGPDLGAEIVVAGAAELFGTEFGPGK